MRELAALESGSLNRDWLTTAGHRDKPGKYRVWPHSQAIGRSQSQRNCGNFLESIGGQRHQFASILRDVVGVVGCTRMRLAHGLMLRLSIHLPRACVDDPTHAIAACRFRHIRRSHHVDRSRGGWLGCSQIDVPHARQVADRIDALRGSHQLGKIQYVATDDGGISRTHARSIPGIENDHLVARSEQFGYHVAAEKAGAACDHDSHNTLPLSWAGGVVPDSASTFAP